MGSGIEPISHGGYLAVDLRAIDTTTGEIAYSRTIEGRTEGGVEQVGPGARPITSIDDGPGSRAVRDACVADFAARERARIETTRKAVRIER